MMKQSSRMTSMGLTILSLPLGSLARGISLPSLLSPDMKAYDPSALITSCYLPLSSSDANDDGILQNDEYVTFISSLSDGHYNSSNTESFNDLPFVIKVNFIYLSCLCNYNGGPEGCCKGTEGGIYVKGSEEGVVPTEEEKAYLEMVCSDTQASIDYAIREEQGESPTASPVSTTASPTTSPISTPTSSPISTPTSSPTSAPTSSPTSEPTTSPTSSPTSSPNASPTSSPTVSPIVAPTAITNAPTKSPTIDQGASNAPTPFTMSPTKSPSTSTTTTVAPTTTTKSPSSTTTTTVEPTTTTKIPTKSPSSTTTTKSPSLSTTPIPDPTPGDTLSPTTSQAPSIHNDGNGVETPTPPTNVETPTPDGDRDIDNGNSGENDDEETSTSESLSAGGIAGIVLASVFVLYAWMYTVGTWKKHNNSNMASEDPNLEEFVGESGGQKGDGDLEIGNNTTNNNGGSGGGGGSGTGAATDGSSLGGGSATQMAASTSPSKSAAGVSSSSSASAAVSPSTPTSKLDSDPTAPIITIAGGPYSPTALSRSSPPTTPPDDHPHTEPDAISTSNDESSDAGASGWSTSDGLSSLNTSPSFDASENSGMVIGTPASMLAATAGVVGGAGLVIAGARSGESDTGSISSASDGMARQAVGSYSAPGQSKVTRDDLDAAIEAGDWAAVGATAALLTQSQSSDVTDTASEKQGSINSKESNVSSVRANELDRLVEAGDWEGVVLAAAKFEGASDAGSMNDESLSEKRDKSEIRAEVEALVRRVVPDEIDNIDEMMIQFDGREEELVETLRTMQERSIAQRARAAVHQSAKLQAKAESTSNAAAIISAQAVVHQSEKLQAKAQSTSNAAAMMRDRSDSSSTASDPHVYESCSSSMSDLGMSEDQSRKTAQSSLELAIDRGDWRAVGEAAAMMGDGSSSRIIRDSEGSSTVSSSLSTSKQERVAHLDALIEKGDWSGIVAAAGKYQAMDEQQDSIVSSLGAPASRAATEEEREALAQADMWQAIANQSKQDESIVAKGASEAADWAISRSLEQMKHSASSRSTDDPDPKKPKIIDDESV